METWWARYATNPDQTQFYSQAHAEAKRMMPVTSAAVIDMANALRYYSLTNKVVPAEREAL